MDGDFGEARSAVSGGTGGRGGERGRREKGKRRKKNPVGIPWSGVACIRGCAACQTRGPIRISFTGGPWMGPYSPPLRRKIRPPGASRRRATDNHVTLLPYRYQSRRHNNRAARVPPPLCAQRWKGKKKGNRRKESSSILGTEPVQYLPSSVHSRTRFREGEDRCPRLERQ